MFKKLFGRRFQGAGFPAYTALLFSTGRNQKNPGGNFSVLAGKDFYQLQCWWRTVPPIRLRELDVEIFRSAFKLAVCEHDNDPVIAFATGPHATFNKRLSSDN